jgi:hypothetical protein
MPEQIDVTVFWNNECDSMSYISFFQADIEDMVLEYEQGRQAMLFTFIPLESLRQWIWDQYCREPIEVVIDEIKY